jgi:parallel beta-helix repeat protein
MATIPFRWRGIALITTVLVFGVRPAEAESGPPLFEIRSNVSLDPGRVYGPIVIKASNITVDGRGAWIVGARKGAPKEYTGTAVSAEHVSNVTLKNINAKGWETGLRVSDGSGWSIEDCNFSDNFHDPAFGWGENGRRGGIVLQRVSRSTLRRNRANRVWDGCVLVESNENDLEANDFSHTSNTCLTLWNASRNRVEHNVLSHGLRIDPGEVHARDSACVLIESGSNDNRFLGNDCTHGGDGIFVRVLNGWVSTGNLFEENDCSYANNNGFEAWSPRNTYLRNHANHCSHGFWLGASDQTRLEGNEASFNGDPKGFHNSPHLPDGGHAGIIFMFGPSSHTIARGNVCRGNHGAGIALVGDIDSAGRKWKAFHWIIEQNRLTDNRWGIYLRFADWIDIAANVLENNEAADIRDDGGVTRLKRNPILPRVKAPPRAVLTGPSAAKVGETVVFDASGSTDPQARSLRFSWDLGDGTTSDKPRVAHVFNTPGFRRLGLTVTNRSLSDLAWRDLYVVDGAKELATEGQSGQWSWIDPESRVTFADDAAVRIQGRTSLRAEIRPYGGGRVSLLYPVTKQAGIPITGSMRLVFWIKAFNENVPAWQGPNPVVTLYESESRSVVLTPKDDLLSQRFNNEEREGWSRFVVPIAGDDLWLRKGAAISTANYLTIGFDSWGAPPLRIWIDGLTIQ